MILSVKYIHFEIFITRMYNIYLHDNKGKKKKTTRKTNEIYLFAQSKEKVNIHDNSSIIMMIIVMIQSLFQNNGQNNVYETSMARQSGQKRNIGTSI